MSANRMKMLVEGMINHAAQGVPFAIPLRLLQETEATCYELEQIPPEELKMAARLLTASSGPSYKQGQHRRAFCQHNLAALMYSTHSLFEAHEEDVASSRLQCLVNLEPIAENRLIYPTFSRLGLQLRGNSSLPRVLWGLYLVRIGTTLFDLGYVDDAEQVCVRAKKVLKGYCSQPVPALETGTVDVVTKLNLRRIQLCRGIRRLTHKIESELIRLGQDLKADGGVDKAAHVFYVSLYTQLFHDKIQDAAKTIERYGDVIEKGSPAISTAYACMKGFVHNSPDLQHAAHERVRRLGIAHPLNPDGSILPALRPDLTINKNPSVPMRRRVDGDRELLRKFCREQDWERGLVSPNSFPEVLAVPRTSSSAEVEERQDDKACQTAGDAQMVWAKSRETRLYVVRGHLPPPNRAICKLPARTRDAKRLRIEGIRRAKNQFLLYVDEEENELRTHRITRKGRVGSRPAAALQITGVRPQARELLGQIARTLCGEADLYYRTIARCVLKEQLVTQMVKRRIEGLKGELNDALGHVLNDLIVYDDGGGGRFVIKNRGPICWFIEKGKISLLD